MRGFTCNVFEQDSSTLINTLFMNISIEQYNWDIGGGESYKREFDQLGDMSLEPLFIAPYVKSGEQIRELFQKHNTYIIFLDLKAFPKDATIQQIETLNDFLESGCELAILMIDGEYLAVYGKNEVVLNQIAQNLQAHCSVHPSFFTDETNPLSTMIAW